MIGGMIRIETFKVIPFLLFFIVFAAFLFLPYFSRVELPMAQMSAFGSETVRAKVEEIIEEGQIDLGGTVQRYQIARVKIVEGDYAGIPMEIDYGKRQVLSGNAYLELGDQILVTLGKRADNVLTAYFVEFVRTTPLLWLLGAFVLAILVISRWKGFRSLLSMVFSLVGSVR